MTQVTDPVENAELKVTRLERQVKRLKQERCRVFAPLLLGVLILIAGVLSYFAYLLLSLFDIRHIIVLAMVWGIIVGSAGIILVICIIDWGMGD